jgi:saccharopine dehydrogenase-like NADP-dependent oxidoreductase
MKVLVLGCGNIGSVAAQDIAQNSRLQIVVGDKDAAKAKETAEKIGKSNVSWVQVDADNQNKTVKVLKDFDLAMGFLPGNLGYQLCEACIEAEKDLVDVSYMSEDPLTLQDRAKEAGVTIVPDCGLAPGISNVLVGHAAAELDRVEAVHMMVGGLPEKPVPPMGYVITWSPESLIDEYTRKAKIVRKRRVIEVEALGGVEEVEFPGVGKLEAFFTDGLRTLTQTIAGAEDMWEKTLRYPGHAEKAKLLEALGFFEDKLLDVGNVKVSPRKLTARLLGKKLRRPDVRDVVALRVEVSGFKKGTRKRYVYDLLDRHDEKRKITAMARTTAFPASIVAQLILKKVVREKGVVPPEKLGMNAEVFGQFWKELKARKIAVNEETVAG